MAKSIMIQGTASDTGKSFLVAALCRIFSNAGYKTVPFKSQNMASNSYVTENGDEVASSIAMQAMSARVEPDARMNPILLKPVSSVGSQVIVNGKHFDTMSGKDYFSYKSNFKKDIKKAFDSLSRENDIIVIEGAGSPAEINLKADDIVNMGVAQLTKSPVVLTGDIARGGVFAALAGTMMLLEPQERELVKGVFINKFIGDVEILNPGVDMLEDIIDRPVLGVIPYLNVDIEKEDSLSRSDSIKKGAKMTVGIVKLPKMTNFNEFDPLTILPDVNVRYVESPTDVFGCDLLIIPGTTSLKDELLWLEHSNVGSCITHFAENEGSVIGVADGYAILGEQIVLPDNTKLEGLGLLPVVSVLQKMTTAAVGQGNLYSNDAFLGADSISYDGVSSSNHIKFTKKSNFPKNIAGATHHGLFSETEIVKQLLENVLKQKGKQEHIKIMDILAYRNHEYDKLAEAVEQHVDMDKIYDIIEKGI